MGGRAHVLVVGEPHLAACAQARLEELEQRWSRFLPDSDVSRANRAAGREVEVHPDTITLGVTALGAQSETGGAFDPLLGADLVALGYDRTFDAINPNSSPNLSRARQRGRLAVDQGRGTLSVPAGCALDPGGIGKGLAADLTVEDLQRHGARGALVNLGGDIRVWGEPPGPDGWVISVDHPVELEAELVRVVLADGAVATSSRLLRRWGPREAPVHHLVNPTTGRPADNGVAGVTVFANTGWRSEAFTKAAFLAGPDGAVGVLEAAGLDGIVVTDDGASWATSNMAAMSV